MYITRSPSQVNQEITQTQTQMCHSTLRVKHFGEQVNLP